MLSVTSRKKGFEPYEQNMTNSSRVTIIPLAFIIFDLYNSREI